MKAIFDRLKEGRRHRLPRRVLAVDIDSAALRVAQVERTGGGAQVHALLSAEVPKDLDLASSAAVGEFLGKFLRDNRLKEAGVLMSVPRSQAILKPLTLPANTSPAEMPAMVRFQVEKQLPFAPAEAVVDYTSESHYAAEDGPREGTDILAAAVRLPVVEHYRQVAQAAGVKLLALGLRASATAECVRAAVPADQRAEALTVVHITADEAEIEILHGDSLVFSRSIVGKIVAGPRADASARGAAVDAVVTEVVRSLQSYQHQEVAEESLQRRIVLLGGTGIEQRVAEALQRMLHAECRLLDLAAALHLTQPVPHSSAFAAALGLAISACRQPALPLDFLNPKRTPVTRDPRKTKVAAIAVGAVAVLLVAFVARGAYFGSKDQVLQRLAADKKKVETDADALKSFTPQKNMLTKWCDQKFDWLGHIAYVSSLFPPREDAYIDSFTAKAETKDIRFSIYARRSETIDELGDRLKKAGYGFQSDLLATTKNDSRYLYTAKIFIKIPANMPDVAPNLPKGMPAHVSEEGQVDEAGVSPFGSPASSGGYGGGGDGYHRPSSYGNGGGGSGDYRRSYGGSSGSSGGSWQGPSSNSSGSSSYSGKSGRSHNRRPSGDSGGSRNSDNPGANDAEREQRRQEMIRMYQERMRQQAEARAAQEAQQAQAEEPQGGEEPAAEGEEDGE